MPPIPDRKADRTEQPVDRHGDPDAEDAKPELYAEQPAETDTEHPHRDDGEQHRIFDVGSGPQRVRQGERERPDRHDAEGMVENDVVHISCGLRREAVEPDEIRKDCEHEQIDCDVGTVGDQQQFSGIIAHLLIASGTDTAGRYREHGHCQVIVGNYFPHRFI